MSLRVVIVVTVVAGFVGVAGGQSVSVEPDDGVAVGEDVAAVGDGDAVTDSQDQQASSAGTNSTASTDPTGRLRAEVRDTNNNPLAGVAVEFVDRDAGSVIATETTDSNGQVAPFEVAPGNYTARLASENYTTFATRVDLDANESETIFVTAESTVGRLRAEVRDSNNSPLAGVAVEFVDRDAGSVIATKTTDSNGVIRPFRATASNYTARLVSDNYTTFATRVELEGDETELISVTAQSNTGRLRAEVADSSNDPVSGVPVEFVDLDSGNVIATKTTDSTGAVAPFEVVAGNYTARLDSANYTAFATRVELGGNEAEVILVTAQSNTGTLWAEVTDNGGNPIANVPVEFENLDSGSVVATRTTNSSGAVSPFEVTAGNYTARIDSGNYTSSGSQVEIQGGDSRRITVAGQPTTGLLSAEVTDNDGNPVPNATVEFVDRNSGTVIATRTTNSNGVAQSFRVPAGNYTARLDSANYTAFGTRVAINGGDSERIVVSAQSTTGIVGGRVTDTGGDPVGAATVRLLNGSTVVAVLVTDANGDFGGVEVQAGAYRVTATAPDYRTDSRQVRLARNGVANVSLALAPQITFVTGRVTDDDGSPVANASVRVEATDGTVANSTTTGANGRYNLSVPVGQYTVVIDKPGYGTSRSTTNVGGTTERLQPVSIIETTDTATVTPTETTSEPREETATVASTPGSTDVAAATTTTVAVTETTTEPRTGRGTAAGDQPGTTTNEGTAGFGPLLLALVIALLAGYAWTRR